MNALFEQTSHCVFSSFFLSSSFFDSFHDSRMAARNYV